MQAKYPTRGVILVVLAMFGCIDPDDYARVAESFGTVWHASFKTTCGAVETVELEDFCATNDGSQLWIELADDERKANMPDGCALMSRAEPSKPPELCVLPRD